MDFENITCISPSTFTSKGLTPYYEQVRGENNLGIEGNCQFATPLKNAETGGFAFPVTLNQTAVEKTFDDASSSQPCRTEKTTFVLNESVRITEPLPHTYVVLLPLSLSHRPTYGLQLHQSRGPSLELFLEQRQRYELSYMGQESTHSSVLWKLLGSRYAIFF